MVTRKRPSRAGLILIFALWVASLGAATLLLGAEAARAMSTIAAWSGAFVTFILLGTGWIKPALITAGFVLLAIAATELIGR